MIAIEFDHRLADHQRAERLFFARTARANTVLAVLMTTFGIVSIATLGIHWWTAAVLVPAPLVGLIRLILAPLAVRHMFRRTPKFHEHTVVTFGDERIHYRTPSIDTNLDWGVFAELIEDDQLFLLRYKAPRSYAVIPKRVFATPAAIDEFRDLIHRKLPRRAA